MVALGWSLYDFMGESTEPADLAERALAMASQEARDPDVLLTRGVAQSLLAHCQWATGREGHEASAREALGLLETLIDEHPSFDG